MAATPKPIREKQKKGMAMQKALRASQGKIMSKPEEKVHLKSVKSKGASKHDLNMIKRSYPHSQKHSKVDLQSAHAHMKKHGG